MSKNSLKVVSPGCLVQKKTPSEALLLGYLPGVSIYLDSSVGELNRYGLRISRNHRGDYERELMT